MLILGKPKAECVVFFIGPCAAICIAKVRVRSVGVDVSIAQGITHVHMGETSSRSVVFLLVRALTWVLPR